MKAASNAADHELPTMEYSIDPLYEEIPFDKMAASVDAKGMEAETSSAKYENPYTFAPLGANVEHNGTSPIVHDSDGNINDEDGSIDEEDMYIDGILPDTVHVTSNGRQVFYNTSPAKGDLPTYATPTEFPYDVPKGAKVAPQKEVAANDSPAKRDQPTYATPTEFPYSVPKNNTAAPKEVVAEELGVQLLDTVSSEYEVMHTSDTLVAGSSGPAMES